MFATLVVSLLFFAVGIIVLVSGILTLQSNYKAPANRSFFAITVAIAIWSSGMALSTLAPDAAMCENFRRFSAIGWGTFYAILLHFIMIITGKSSSIKKWWFYLCLYLPAFLSLFAFAIPNAFNPNPYNLHQTDYGWTNVAQHNIWDWIFYAYYIGFLLIGLLLLYRSMKESSDKITRKQAGTILLSLIFALVLGTITDVVLSSIYNDLPQMAPIIMLIPVLSIYHVLQKDSFGITEGINKNTNYISIFASVLLYILLSAIQIFLSNKSFIVDSKAFDETVTRGIIIQLQMFISIYLVLKENRPGYISAVTLNSIGLLSAIAFLIKYESIVSLPGIISYSSVLVLVTIIKNYKKEIFDYIRRINTQIIKEKFYSSIFKQAPIGIAIMNDKRHTKNEGFEDININPMYAKFLVGQKKNCREKHG